jgi:hypothetical protein
MYAGTFRKVYLLSPQNFMVIELKIPINKIQIPAKFEMRISKYQPAAFVSPIMVLFVICKFRSLRFICYLKFEILDFENP